jgi:amino acid adenylation domain-containing protein
LVERVVERRSDAIALQFGEEVCTYAALNQRANKCANYLRELGIGPDVVVGVIMERSIELVVALLAILKAGGAYLPLSSDCPAERLKFMLEDAGVSTVLTHAETSDLVNDLVVTNLNLDVEEEEWQALSFENPPPLAKAGHLAYVIYTSGSTGKPKGCMIEHAAICNRLIWMRDQYGVLEADRILQKTPYTFDVSVWEFFLPLISGATMVLSKPAGHKDVGYLKELIQNQQVTIGHFVPSMLRFFLRQDGVSECTTLRHLFSSGEALPYELMMECRRRLPAKLHNLYGPTEAAVDVTYWECSERPDRKVPIGRPITGTRIHILNEKLQPVPPGETGELFIGGVAVARGYLNRPELTKERFVTDPFSENPSARLYRTGDRARMLADGHIEFLGRLDFQVKLRGFRIELGEIETALREHKAVEDAAVLLREAESEDPKLVAYLVFRKPAPSTKEIREFVKLKLPEYMVPNVVVPLPGLPLSANGKLDRAALPWPAAREASATLSVTDPSAPVGSSTRAPHSAEAVFSQLADAEIAADLRGLFQKALGLNSLDDDADLFDLGATSFTMVQAVEHLRADYGVVVPVDVFFDTPTIKAIAGYVQERTGQPGQTSQSCVACATTSTAPATTSPGAVTLERPRFSDRAFRPAASVRRFSRQPVPASSLGHLLSLLRCNTERKGPRYLYSSAGGLRAVQAYLWISENGVEGLATGYYYYHPEEHRLHLLGTKPAVETSLFNPYDRSAFEAAGFLLFLVAQMDAIQPIYGNASPVLAVVEAGYMGQLLMEHRASFGLGLCPVTGVDFSQIRDRFQLEPTHRFLHCLIGGIPADKNSHGPAGGLWDSLRETGSGIHGHCQDYTGERTFSHFIEAKDQWEGLPTIEQKEELHRKHLHLRTISPASKSVALSTWQPEAGYYLLRSAKRTYSDGPVRFERFGRFMGMLGETGGEPAGQRLYASLLTPHRLKVYAYIKPDGVERIPEGLYQYNGEAHELSLVSRTLSADLKACYTPFNRTHFKLAKFCLFLVGPTKELKPLVGEDSTYLALLESGYIGQLLLDRQAEFEMGVCPIGGMRYEKIRDDFHLDQEDVFLHSFVCGEVEPECDIPWEPLEATPQTGSRVQEPLLERALISTRGVAVVGLSGRYPGAADLDAFARNLEAGKSSFRELLFGSPENYRGHQNASGGEVNRHWGGYLDSIDCFDSLLFQITPAEARSLDPQERLFLETAWECLENSGYTAAELNRVAQKVGVFVGAMWDDYQHYNPNAAQPPFEGQAISAHHSSIANRVSFFFDFKGPSVAVNTSCSSAMTALHFGYRSVSSGECNAALVGGVNLMTHPYHHSVLASTELLSPDNVCRPFGLRANGWIAGEGLGVVLLKPLNEALRDGDTIHGVILGTSISHSGRTCRYGAPDSHRQAEGMREALAQAGVAPNMIHYVEAAAPGAGMADASESAAIKEIFDGTDTGGAPIYVGSIKANIGHLESASAMSQLSKVLLQMKHRRIFPTLGFQPINPLVQWQNTRLRIADSAVDWPSPGNGPKRALIDAYGATGSGGHVVIEDFSRPELPDTEVETLIALSAATKAQLVEVVRRLHTFLKAPESAGVRISDLGYTLRVGRVHMKERLALVVRSRAELRERLDALLAGGDEPGRPGSGELNRVLPDGTVNPASPLAELATMWVEGTCVLGRTNEDSAARRVPLPSYPFAKEHHWLGARPEVRDREPTSYPSALRERLRSYLKHLFAEVTEIPLDNIDTQSMFDVYGMTSLMAKRLSERLAKDFGKLSAALLFERQTIEDLAHYFLEHHGHTLQALFGDDPLCSCQQESSPEPEASAPAQHLANPRRIAVIGISGRYPKAANVFTFWENLKNGVDCISEIPSDRWDDARVQTQVGRHSRWGGFIDGVDEFDPLFFKISPREAQELDPQERLFLQEVWHLFEDAGCPRSSFGQQARNRMGVFVGVMYGEYQLHSSGCREDGSGVPVSSLYGSIANRVSYFFDFHGPSMAVDTLCSSSLTALHLAVRSIQSGECDQAVVGGVNVSIHPNKYLLHARSAMSSSDGRCRSFGSGGDGFVPGEGVGAVLLKPLEAALRDGDQIYGLIKSTAINHDGKTHGYTVPNPNAQTAMISDALRSAGVDPRSVSYVEAHGTGTALGDPIEISGLTKAFGGTEQDKQYCAIGSVKSNIGHLESAAGVAGLTKILLQMRHKKLVPSLHSRELNPEIPFGETPFFVPQTLHDWECPLLKCGGTTRVGPRLACISSFGAGGSNAHAVVEEYEVPDARDFQPAPVSPQLIVLSAKDHERLRIVMVQLRDFIAQNPTYKLLDIAYTLQLGREALEERLAFTVNSLDELKVRLDAILECRDLTGTVFRGTLDNSNSLLRSLLKDEDLQGTMSNWIDKRKYDHILKAWVEGASVDWRRLHRGGSARKVSLPNYPFARERYWVPKNRPQPASGALGIGKLHPLLHQNTSVLWEQRFSSMFDGTEFFLKDHCLRGTRVLPASALLEMARAAVEQSTSGRGEAIHLKNVAWIQPFSANGAHNALHVGLLAHDQSVDFKLFTEDASQHRTIISQGTAVLGSLGQRPTLNLPALLERLQPSKLTPEGCYEAFRAFGLEHGPAFLSLKEVRADETTVLAKLSIPDSAREEPGSYILHPSLLDGMFQATLALAGPNAAKAAIPYSLDELTCYGQCEAEMWVHVRPAVPNATKLDLDLCDPSGAVCIAIKGFSTRELETTGFHGTSLSRPALREESVADVAAQQWARRFVVLCGFDKAVAAGLAIQADGRTWTSLDLGTGDLSAQYGATVTHLFALIQRAMAEAGSGNSLLQIVFPRTPQAVIYSGLVGLLGTAHQENPTFHGQLIEVASGQAPTPDVLSAALEENERRPEDSFVVYEDSRRMVRKWEPLPVSDTPTKDFWVNGGVYLISGGAGRLGLLFAREITRSTKSCVIVLVGRSPLAEEKRAALRSLETPGVVIQYRQTDVADARSTHALVESILKEHGSLSGVLHAAGLLRDGFILQQSTDDLRTVLAPKVNGAVNLDQATQNLNLDCFVLFSSVVGALGNAGQAGYSAANGFLDAFAQLRNLWVTDGKRKGRTLSINWPFWKEGGMRLDPGILRLLESSGMRPLETPDGLWAFGQVVNSGASQVLVQTAPANPVRPPSPSRLPAAPAVNAKIGGPLTERALRFFRTLLAATVQCPVERIKVDEPFDSYGIDSVMVMQMTNELEKSFGSLSKTLFFEHHTIRSLTMHFVETREDALRRLLGDSPTQSPLAETGTNHRPLLQGRPTTCYSAPVPASTSSGSLDIAIIGLSGRYPQANDLDAFWENLRQGRDCITEVPLSRWDWKSYYDPDRTRAGAHFGKWGGFMDNVESFDPLFFNIAPKDAPYMDPQERLFLEATWTALEDAGYHPGTLRGDRGPSAPAQVGVYAGVMYSEYQLFAHEATLSGNPTVVGNIYASIANRVSYFLDLHGPSMTIDTMCSSSLTCLHLACQDLKHGLTDIALAGGVNVTIHPNKFLLLSEGQFISSAGRCASFGKTGDGYVPGEGVGVVVLKRLAEAIRDGDHIYAVIKGTAVNHGGKTNGFTVPDPDAQHAVIARAMAMAQMDPARVSYVEAHSTGTPLGDPIELAGLRKAFASCQDVNAHFLLGSVKSNIGHCEAAAGMAALTKVLLQMKHGEITPSLHSDVLNPHLGLEHTPFEVNQALRKWERRIVDGHPLPHVAGISGFGAGGSNAHVIVEEYIESRTSNNALLANGPFAIVMSARNRERLAEVAARLHRFLLASPDVDLVDLAYTLQLGRQPMEERLGFVAASRDELLSLLEQAARGHAGGQIHRGRVVDGTTETLRVLADDEDVDLGAAVKRWVRKGKLEKLVEVWVTGMHVDWNLLYGGSHPRRLSLPTYPFARERYWLPRIGAAITPPPIVRSAHEPATPADNQSGTWLTLREEWTPRPWPTDSDWKSGIRAYSGKRVVVLGADRAECGRLLKLIEDLERTAGMRAGVQVELLSLADLDAWRLEQPPDIVLALAPSAENDNEDGAHVAGLFRLSQRLMRDAWDREIRLYHVHDSSEAKPRLRLEALSGLLRSAMLENPNHIWRSVAVTAGDTCEAVLREWLVDAGERSFVSFLHTSPARLQHRIAEHSVGPGPEPLFRHGGTYVIAGGLGPVGEQLCRELASRYQARLVLLSRGPWDERKQEQCRELESLGARVTYYQVDITDRRALEVLWKRLTVAAGAIHGVIHLARLVEDSLILSKSEATFQSVIRAKIEGTVNLDELTASEPLDFFLLFSSMAALGIRGSCDYGYSSAFQNAFAKHRQHLAEAGARSGQTVACGWGAWDVDQYYSEQRNAQVVEAGFSLITMRQAWPWIERRLWQGDPFLGLMLVHDRTKALQDLNLKPRTAKSDPVSSALHGRIEEWEKQKRDGKEIAASEVAKVLRSDQVCSLDGTLIERLHTLLRGSGNGHTNHHEPEIGETSNSPDVTETVKGCLAEILGLPEVEITRSFLDYGMNSISGMRFALLLEKKLKVRVLPQWLMEHPTTRALAEHLSSAVETYHLRRG